MGGHLFEPAHTSEVCIRDVVNGWEHQGSDDLGHKSDQEDKKYGPRSIPHGINTQNHHDCNCNQKEARNLGSTVTHNRRQK